MGAARPKRPDPGHAMLLPRTGGDPKGSTVQRAFDAVSTTVQQVQKTVAAVETRIGGRELAVQVFTANGTYTPTVGATTAIIKVQACGGGGGGAIAGAGVVSYGAGGGGGTYLEHRIPGLVSGGAVVCPSTGGAGGSAAGGNGATGGDASIVVNGMTYTAKGGTGGQGSAVPSGPSNGALGYALGGQPQSGSTAVDRPAAWPGQPAMIVSTGFGGIGAPGAGAGATMGIGGHVGGTNTTPSGAAGYGAGGAGAGAVNGSAAGEAGRPARVEVWEYS